jgi:hypothetical protein
VIPGEGAQRRSPVENMHVERFGAGSVAQPGNVLNGAVGCSVNGVAIERKPGADSLEALLKFGLDLAVRSPAIPRSSKPTHRVHPHSWFEKSKRTGATRPPIAWS